MISELKRQAVELGARAIWSASVDRGWYRAFNPHARVLDEDGAFFALAAEYLGRLQERNRSTLEQIVEAASETERAKLTTRMAETLPAGYSFEVGPFELDVPAFFTAIVNEGIAKGSPQYAELMEAGNDHLAAGEVAEAVERYVEHAFAVLKIPRCVRFRLPAPTSADRNAKREFQIPPLILEGGTS